jgi:ATP-dependent Clp protease protease subunit
MPIGVPRILYSWSDELPPQWIDIYNFIYRRRMVFLLQFLDKELCNQICGLLINIHMEDRSKELDGQLDTMSTIKKTKRVPLSQAESGNDESEMKKLLTSEEDLGIEQNFMLERYTLQKIAMDWFNWNAQFFDYTDEASLIQLAELLSASPSKQDARSLFSQWNETGSFDLKSSPPQIETGLDLYSVFRIYADITGTESSYNSLTNEGTDFEFNKSTTETNEKRKKLFSSWGSQTNQIPEKLNWFEILRQSQNLSSVSQSKVKTKTNISSLFSKLATSQLWGKKNDPKNQIQNSEKALSQRKLKKEYKQSSYDSKKPSKYGWDPKFRPYTIARQLLTIDSSLNYSEQESTLAKGQAAFTDYYNERTQSYYSDEENKKVFMLINSFGGSVGSGITIHDALQFIKAGSLTIGLGVAASAASLALAGGTIGERYITEGCHTMIHQPESEMSGQASDIWIDSIEIMKLRQEVASIYSLSTYRPRHKILRDLDRDFYLTATETISYGLADEIATNDVMHEIIEMTRRVWDYHDSKQQLLFESYEKSQIETETMR